MNKVDAIAVVSDASLEALTSEFEAVIQSVEAQIAQEAPQPGDEQAITLVMQEGIEKRDRLAALIFAFQDRAERRRKIAGAAEALARSDEAKAKFLKGSIEAYMLCKGIRKIEGEVHYFRVSKNQPMLVVTDESRIPRKFFKTETSEVLDKLEVCYAIERGEEVPGAYVEKDRIRLDVK